MISAVIVTYNEAYKLQHCLKSLHGWTDEVIIVDLGSQDDVHKVAADFSAQVISHPYVSHVELVRNFAIKQCRGDWILVLDPDEIVSSTLKKYLLYISVTRSKGVFNIPRRNIFFHRWIRNTNFWPDYQVRFFSKGAVKWRPLLHSYPDSYLKPLCLPAEKKYAITHVSYPSFYSFIVKQVRYAGIRASERFEAGETASLVLLVYLLAREFISKFIKHKGFLDHKQGFALIIGMMYYLCLVELKLHQLRSKTKNDVMSEPHLNQKTSADNPHH